MVTRHYLVSGVVVVETIFSYPGLAKLMVDGVQTRDIPLVQACAMIFCGTYVVLILIADRHLELPVLVLRNNVVGEGADDGIRWLKFEAEGL